MHNVILDSIFVSILHFNILRGRSLLTQDYKERIKGHKYWKD